MLNNVVINGASGNNIGKYMSKLQINKYEGILKFHLFFWSIYNTSDPQEKYIDVLGLSIGFIEACPADTVHTV